MIPNENISDIELQRRLLRARQGEARIDKVREERDLDRIQRSDKGASLFDFFSMIADLIAKTMSDLDVTFDPDEGHTPTSPNEEFGHPYICYKLISRTPIETLKPRQIENIDDGTDRKIQIWVHKFTSVIQFNVFAGNYKAADEIMIAFEELIHRYTGYFKKNGVGEILFLKQLTDDNLEQYRQRHSVRSLQYRVDTQIIRPDFSSTIEEIYPETSNI